MTTRKTVVYTPEDKSYVFECPHCGLLIQVSRDQVNCQIFRHGWMKRANVQVPPHTSKSKCDQLVKDDLIYGCGKPFRLFYNDKHVVTHVDKCGYI